ncbi:unnamed protein product [Protopolystoma xenopodis]|uniref:Uncharacterized protein n=1 Tax=Protopolystoma xenopodis TaxID=117903 RepID=A0A448XMQ6_9PLAT|nr:unnamed protein product [Protopolystoma xenopodis]
MTDRLRFDIVLQPQKVPPSQASDSPSTSLESDLAPPQPFASPPATSCPASTPPTRPGLAGEEQPENGRGEVATASRPHDRDHEEEVNMSESVPGRESDLPDWNAICGPATGLVRRASEAQIQLTAP